MPMAGSGMSSIMLTIMQGAGCLGTSTPKFCDAAGNGTVNSIVGKKFQTLDVGTLPGTGKGTGTAVIGIIPPVVMAYLTAQMAAKLGVGTSLPIITTAFTMGIVGESAKATLTSNHTPTYVGAATIVPGSIPVTASEAGGLIKTEGDGKQFFGTSWPILADILGGAVELAYKTATGALVIAGAPAGDTKPGGGSGTGTVA